MRDEQIGFEMSKAAITEMVISRYVEEKCPYCGRPMTREDLRTAIVSDVDVRPCHETCWDTHVSKD